MRRTLVVLCSGGPYHVPTLARVALFPIHLDPPTRQHRELFRLLLGAPDLSTPARSPAVSLGNHTAGPTISSSSHANDGGGFSQGAMSGGHPDYARQGAQGTTSAAASSSLLGVPGASTLAAPSSSSSSLPSGMADGEPMSCGTSSPFWYMEAFATSLREDSQLAPFDDVILIPYTRGPVSLRQSTHLAAMAVLAARGLAHVHVDFTALEHPDESMPIIYELVCKYTNSALVHFLQDAYEMQNWSHFSEFKNSVPMMLLQTQSFPPRALERQRPLGSVSRLTSRQYHSPTGPYVHTAAEAAYYRQAEQFMAASAALRRRNPNPMALTGEDTERAEGVEGEMRERYESASLVDRESDYFADEPDLASHRGKGGVTGKGAERNSSSWVWTEADMMKGTLPPSGRGTLASRSPHLSSDHDERQPSSGHAGSRAAEERGDRGGADSADHSQESWLASSHDGGAHGGLGLNYADCARGRWWNTVGGRGDDEVELSRCYWSSTSSSWLGGGTGAASSLPDWMEEVGAVNARAKLDQHHRSSSGNEGSHAPAVGAAAHAGTAASAASQQGPASESGAVVAPLDGIDGVLSAAGIVGADRAHFDLDTVVSDDGFALAVDGRPGDCSRAAEAKGGATGAAATAYASSSSTEKHSAGGEKAPAAASAPQPGGKVRSAEARESADEDTRKRYLTREMEEVQKMLDGMLHSTAAQRALLASSSSSASTASVQQGAGPHSAVSSASQPSNTAAGGGSAQPSSPSSSSLLASSHAASSSRGAPHAFGLYATHHHDVHSHTRRRHRCVRQLLEELFPPRIPGPPSVAASTTATALSALEQGMHEMYASAVPSHRFGGSDGHDAEEGGDGGAKPAGSRRSVSSASIFTAAVKTSPAHVSLLQHAARIFRGPGDSSGDSSVASEPPASMGHPYQHSDSNNNGSSGGGGGASSWIDAPLVEVHPITRSTGADVRQALWEQDIHPSSILMDCVQRYMEGHGLYRDPRKATAASLYAGIAGYEVNRGGGGGGGVGGIGGTGSDVNVAFRDPAMAGSGSTSSSSISAGSAIMDGRSGVRRVAPRDTSTLSFPGLIPRLELHYDRNNLLAREQYEKLRIFQCHDGDEPDLIVPIGGDGYMMHCIRKNWRRFIPFYGVNAGHVGYLLNDRATLEELFSSPLKLHFTTMLYCQAEKESDTGERMLLSELAFNDAWVERSSGQTALIRILVNGQERIRRLRGDGVLVSTAAGSTAYSQALGASPVPVGAPLIQVVGSNVVSPAQWRPAHLDQEDQVEFEVIDSTKRPCRCYVDSVDVGNVTRLLVRSSRVAGVTLAFSKSCDLQHKLYQMQFPKTL